jgi:hypothetical protein
MFNRTLVHHGSNPPQPRDARGGNADATEYCVVPRKLRAVALLSRLDKLEKATFLKRN